MARETTYSDKGDLLIGDIALGAAYDPAKFVESASDEIDSYLGHIYEIPIDTEVEVTRLTLKRLNNWLASGRLIMAVATAGQDSDMHAYGWSLVTQAMDDLRSIMDGSTRLTGVDVVSTTTVDDATGPSIINGDDESRVDAFYTEFEYRGLPGERLV